MSPIQGERLQQNEDDHKMFQNVSKYFKMTAIKINDLWMPYCLTHYSILLIL